MSSNSVTSQIIDDVMLRRALGHVERGFYIDVEAWSPDEVFVTKGRGRREVNVDPIPVEEWERILVDADCRFVDLDGLDRFCVARERSELEAAFAAPPNVLMTTLQFHSSSAAL